MRVVLGILALAATLAACGGGGSSDDSARLDLTTPKPKAAPVGGGTSSRPVSRAEASTIRGWADTLRAGHPKAAARYFALPSGVANGTPLIILTRRAQAEEFNRELPCGARVVSLHRDTQGYVVAEFRLTERPGPGSCGIGTGDVAFCAFRIRKHHIVQWIRLPDPETPPQTAS